MKSTFWLNFSAHAHIRSQFQNVCNNTDLPKHVYQLCTLNATDMDGWIAL